MANEWCAKAAAGTPRAAIRLAASSCFFIFLSFA
jgi:hypothetical protein